MSPILLLSFGFLVIGFCLAMYNIMNVLSERWDKAQESKTEKTASQFEEMFIFLDKKILLRIYLVIPFIFATIAFVLTKKWWLSGVLLAVGVIFPFWLVRFMDDRRRKKFIVQLVDGLMIMNSCLKGGLTLTQSFEVLSEEMTPPISQEVSLLNREIKMGVPLEEALIRMDKRMPSEEMTLVSSAIIVARETGGDLTKVFAKLVETIRDRLKLKELIATLTLQSRLQAIIISLLGPAFFFIVRKMRPDHFDIMWQTELGRILMIIALVLQIIGFVLIIIFGRIRI
ncbi:MAG: type II secretion system F family protein [Candidatus Omnitrophica bacterium]|nr:type II secretion system F family protein [Candidatus Omnitrophota bacterium]MDD5081661.1 type II secretion system F family protein [Candidatus Omnitrophota bacterium]